MSYSAAVRSKFRKRLLKAKLPASNSAEDFRRRVDEALGAVAQREGVSELLGQAADRQEAFASWYAELPKAKAADWLLDLLSDRLGVRFRPALADDGRAQPLPPSARATFLEQLRTFVFTGDGYGEPADSDDVEVWVWRRLEDLVRGHPLLEQRLELGEFEDADGANLTHGFRDALGAHLRAMDLLDPLAPVAILKFVNAKLGIAWMDPARQAAADGPAKDFPSGGPFEIGDRVSHAKFGQGEVIRVVDGKLHVRFIDGERALRAP